MKYWIIGIFLVLTIITLTFILQEIYGMMIDVQVICELTNFEPYYNCNKTWLLIISDTLPMDMCSTPGELHESVTYSGCIFFQKKVIFVPIGNNEVDYCGRTVIHHELLHMKYPWKTDEIHHDSRCILTW